MSRLLESSLPANYHIARQGRHKPTVGETCVQGVIFRLIKGFSLRSPPAAVIVTSIKDGSSGAPSTLFVYVTNAYHGLLFPTFSIQISLWLFCSSLLVRDHFI